MLALAEAAGGAAARVESLGPLPFVARPAVQPAVLNRVADATAAEGGAVLTEGVSGVRKTRLIDALRHELRPENAAPLVCVRAQDGRPLGSLHDLAEHLCRESTAAGMPLPRTLMALLRRGGTDAASVEGTHAVRCSWS